MVSMDWTDFDADGQSTIAVNLITDHGRATPLLWKTVDKSTLKNNRARYEDQILLICMMLASLIKKPCGNLICVDDNFEAAR